jgi:CopG antitoxin of type II toxin-antitoxin system
MTGWGNSDSPARTFTGRRACTGFRHGCLGYAPLQRCLTGCCTAVEDWEAPPARPSAAISLRIDPLVLTRLQQLAKQREMPYQRLLKQFVEERLAEEGVLVLPGRRET